MSRKRDRYEQSLGDLVDSIDDLREVLLRYKRATTRLIASVARGEPAIAGLESVGASTLRPELSEALDGLDAARHKARVDLFAVAMEDGDTIANVGRSLSFSRQLASRIAAENRR